MATYLLCAQSLVQAIFAGSDISPLSMDTTGKPLIYLACQIVVYTKLAILFDYALSNPSIRAKVRVCMCVCICICVTVCVSGACRTRGTLLPATDASPHRVRV